VWALRSLIVSSCGHLHLLGRDRNLGFGDFLGSILSSRPTDRFDRFVIRGGRAEGVDGRRLGGSSGDGDAGAFEPRWCRSRSLCPGHWRMVGQRVNRRGVPTPIGALSY
jgi:hypothetical protein